MNFLTLKQLNIKLLDFTTLLSPLGVVKKIVSNGEKHLFEINFHNKINIYTGKYQLNKKTNTIDNTFLKLFYDSKYGLIINENSCIIEIPNSIQVDDKLDDLKSVVKKIRKMIPKDCSNILNGGLNLEKRKITDPESINIINFNGFQKVDL